LGREQCDSGGRSARDLDQEELFDFRRGDGETILPERESELGLGFWMSIGDLVDQR